MLGVGDDEVVIWSELPAITRETFVEEYERLCSLRERDPLVFELLVQALAEQLDSYRQVMRDQRGELPGGA